VLASGSQLLPRDLRRTAFTRRAFGRVHVTTRGVDPAASRLPRRIGSRLPAVLAPPAVSAITVCALLRPTRLLPRPVTANGVSQSRSALRDPPPAASFDPSNSVCLASSASLPSLNSRSFVRHST
jgi:hypothetical protein